MKSVIFFKNAKKDFVLKSVTLYTPKLLKIVLGFQEIIKYIISNKSIYNL